MVEPPVCSVKSKLLDSKSAVGASLLFKILLCLN